MTRSNVLFLSAYFSKSVTSLPGNVMVAMTTLLAHSNRFYFPVEEYSKSSPLSLLCIYGYETVLWVIYSPATLNLMRLFSKKENSLRVYFRLWKWKMKFFFPFARFSRYLKFFPVCFGVHKSSLFYSILWLLFLKKGKKALAVVFFLRFIINARPLAAVS